MNKSCLVLQGGGMRSMYTSGVLDAFLDSNVFINNIYAVSAGCYSALSYLSRQRGRTYRVNTTYLKDKRYINFKRLLTNGNVINTDFIFNEVSKELDPFDYEEFKKNCERFVAVSTNCDTGKAKYALVKDMEKDEAYIKASAALPLFTSLVEVDGLTLTDGGVSDSIPISKALEDGFVNNVIVLTRPKEYIMRKTKFMKLKRIKYKKYPNLIKAMQTRMVRYNSTMELINELEGENKIVVIRPSESLNISNLEKNIEKISKIYNMGYKDCMSKIEKIKEFIIC